GRGCNCPLCTGAARAGQGDVQPADGVSQVIVDPQSLLGLASQSTNPPVTAVLRMVAEQAAPNARVLPIVSDLNAQPIAAGRFAAPPEASFPGSRTDRTAPSSLEQPAESGSRTLGDGTTPAATSPSIRSTIISETESCSTSRQQACDACFA